MHELCIFDWRLLFNYGNIGGQEGLTVNTSKSTSLF